MWPIRDWGELRFHYVFTKSIKCHRVPPCINKHHVHVPQTLTTDPDSASDRNQSRGDDPWGDRPRRSRREPPGCRKPSRRDLRGGGEDTALRSPPWGALGLPNRSRHGFDVQKYPVGGARTSHPWGQHPRPPLIAVDPPRCPIGSHPAHGFPDRRTLGPVGGKHGLRGALRAWRVDTGSPVTAAHGPEPSEDFRGRGSWQRRSGETPRRRRRERGGSCGWRAGRTPVPRTTGTQAFRTVTPAHRSSAGISAQLPPPLHPSTCTAPGRVRNRDLCVRTTEK